jgi:hypothetical protein
MGLNGLAFYRQSGCASRVLQKLGHIPLAGINVTGRSKGRIDTRSGDEFSEQFDGLCHVALS